MRLPPVFRAFPLVVFALFTALPAYSSPTLRDVLDRGEDAIFVFADGAQTTDVTAGSTTTDTRSGDSSTQGGAGSTRFFNDTMVSKTYIRTHKGMAVLDRPFKICRLQITKSGGADEVRLDGVYRFEATFDTYSFLVNGDVLTGRSSDMINGFSGGVGHGAGIQGSFTTRLIYLPVDQWPPVPALNLQSQTVREGVLLSWQIDIDKPVATHFEIYRSASANFLARPNFKRLATVAARTQFLDNDLSTIQSASVVSYYIVSVGRNGLRSNESNMAVYVNYSHM